jgi:hypothetical protein
LLGPLGNSPAAKQDMSDGHATAFGVAAEMGVIAHEAPAFEVEKETPLVEEPAPTATQCMASGHDTARRSPDSVLAVQVAPAFVVTRMNVPPTATQSLELGHETPSRLGVPAGRRRFAQVLPPFPVA